jgi:hypothetical protein
MLLPVFGPEVGMEPVCGVAAVSIAYAVVPASPKLAAERQTMLTVLDDLQR